VLAVSVDNRLSQIFLPVIGSGHGGLKAELSLFIMTLALSEALCKPLGPRIDINVIVFRRDDRSEPEISPKSVKRVLRNAIGLFKLESTD